MSQIKVFINLLDRCFKYLKDVLPDNREIKIGYEKFNLMKSINPRKIFEQFFIYIYPHKTPIMNKNEQYFLDMEVDDSGNKGVLDLKSIWNENITEEQKNIIWKYSQNLVRVVEKIAIKSSTRRV